MKSKNKTLQHLPLAKFIALSLGLSIAGLSHSAQATTLTWDGGDATFNGTYGGTGTWGLSTANWSSASSDVAWTDSSAAGTDTAVFTGTAGTVTLNTNLSALGLQFTTTGYTISGTSGLTLGSGGIDASALTSGTTTISSNLTAAHGYQNWKVGTGGTLDLSGSTITRNTGVGVNFSTTGTIKTALSNTNGILGGWATVGNGGGSGATADWAAVDGSGNIVAYTGYTDVSGNQTGAGASAQNWRTPSAGGNTVTLTESATINSLVVRGDFLVGSGKTLTLGSGGLILSGISRWIKGPNGNTSDTGQLTSGLASGELFVDVASSAADANNWRIWTKIVDNGGTAVKLVKTGPGLVILENANSYTGGTTINAGTLAFSNNTSFGSGAVTVNGQATIKNTAGVTTTNNIAVNAATTLDVTGNNWFLNGNISGSGDITRGTGATLSLFLGGDNSGYTGTFTIQSSGNSVVRFNAASAGSENAKWVVNQGTNTRASIEFGTGTIKFGSLTGTGFLSGSVTAGTKTIEVGNLGLNETFSGVINENSPGVVAVTKVGTGTWTLSGASSYTGATTVNAGTLSVTSLANGETNSNIGKSTNVAGNLILNGGTLNYTGAAVSTDRLFSLQSSSTIDASGSGAVNFTNTGSMGFNAGTAAKTLTLTGTSTGANTIAAVIGDNTGATSVTKSGAGTWVLSGTNTYTGKTTVTGGSLALGSGGSIADSSEIALNGGNFNVSAVAGYSTAATQALTGSGSISGDIIVNGTLAIGNSPGTMTFNDDLTIGSSAVSNFEFTDIGLGSGTYDLALGGDGAQTATFGGTLNLFFSGGTYANNSSVQIFDFENYSGGFNTVNFSGLGAGQSAVFDTSTGFVTVIPEPGAALLGGLGILVLLRRRRN